MEFSKEAIFGWGFGENKGKYILIWEGYYDAYNV